MSGSIRLHPEHGVNPTVSVCFFCAKDKNELALLGASYKGEAPRRMVLDYVPCEECQTHMAKGITLLECTAIPNTPNQPSVQRERDVYPTGRWAVITEDAARRMLSNEDGSSTPQLEATLKYRKAFVEPGIIPMEAPGSDTQQ